MTRGTMIYFDGIVNVEVEGICFLHDIKLRKSWLLNGFLRMGAL